MEGHIEETLKKLASVTAEALIHEAPVSPMHSERAYKEMVASALLADCFTIRQRIEQAAAILTNGLEELAKINGEIHPEEISLEFAKMTAYFSHQQMHLAEDKTVQELSGFSEKMSEALYQAAKLIYEKGLYPDASDAFFFLTLLNSKNSIFWLALGNCEYFCKRYEPALIAYAFASFMNPCDPFCHIYASKCYEEIQEVDNATNSLDLALFVIDQNSERAGEAIRESVLKEKARLIKKS